MNVFGIVIGILAAVILFMTFGVNVVAFCAAAIIVLVIVAAVTRRGP
jgi:uncharacterized membrane protein YgaE (UPF0421/DUF939 family)